MARSEVVSMSSTGKTYDVLILGAGAAGLACAREIARSSKGQRLGVLVVEARDRVGGRVFTKPTHSLPVELGAEFIHGRPPALMKLLEETRVPYVDALDHHL